VSQTFACPNCGYQLPVGTPTCGNCGTVLQGGTPVPPPLAASGIRPGAVITVLLAVGLAGAAFFARDQIADLFESAGDAVEDASQDFLERDFGGGGVGGGAGRGGSGGEGDVEIGYRHVTQIVRDMRAGGVPCSPAQVDHSDDVIETGSCQSNGSHVQINIYFHPGAIESAKDFYREFAFASVHDANWWVSGETALMARIQKAIGGRLHRPQQ
jgi:hypothetical protein